LAGVSSYHWYESVPVLPLALTLKVALPPI
jgi:hypothetical protein